MLHPNPNNLQLPCGVWETVNAVDGGGVVGFRVECYCEGGDNLLTVREAGQRAKVLQLF